MDNVIEDSKEVSVIKVESHIIYNAIKRIFDIIFSFVGCIFLLPVALVVKISYLLHKDYEPIFFTQDRIGKNGKTFKFYKFRTMVQNADKILEELMEKDENIKEEYQKNKKLTNDPRITKMGKKLRDTSIDELPQLINILKGDMTLIGNRPYLPREKVDMLDYYNDIVKTKPGLTGYWQVSGRSDTTFLKRLKLESYYSNNYSFKMDIKIFFKTFVVVLGKKGSK